MLIARQEEIRRKLRENRRTSREESRKKKGDNLERKEKEKGRYFGEEENREIIY